MTSCPPRIGCSDLTLKAKPHTSRNFFKETSSARAGCKSYSQHMLVGHQHLGQRKYRFFQEREKARQRPTRAHPSPTLPHLTSPTAGWSGDFPLSFLCSSYDLLLSATTLLLNSPHMVEGNAGRRRMTKEDLAHFSA